MAPFLLAIASDLETDLARVGTLVALNSVTWGLTSLVTGPASDRLGRRPILIAGLLVLSGSRVLLGLATSYPVAAVAQLLGGIGGGAFMGAVFATVSDHVPSGQRGRALGSIITGQSLAFVFGVPLVTLVGAYAGWRGAVLAQGLALLLTTLPAWLTVPEAPGVRSHGLTSALSVRAVLTRRLVALLGASAMERTCFVLVAVYLATFLMTSYGVSLAGLALALGLVALGNLVGNVLGGRLADRVPDRPLAFALCSAVTGLLALPLMLWQPTLGVSVTLGFAYTLANALGRPALMAALSDVPARVRGTVLGLNITSASFGWLGATALGGWLIGRFGFGALGVFSAVAGGLGAALAIAGAATRPVSYSDRAR